MEISELEQRIEDLIKTTVQIGIDNPSYHKKRHEALAKQYSGGEMAYYDKQIDELLQENDSFIGHIWVNSDCPNMGKAILVEQIKRFYVDFYNKRRNEASFDEKRFLEFVKEDLESFFIKYFTYIYLKANSNNATPKSMLNNIDTHINCIASIVDVILRYPIDVNETTYKVLYEEPIIAANATYTSYKNDINNAPVNKLLCIRQDLQQMQASLSAYYIQNPQKVEQAKHCHLNPYEATNALIDRAIVALPIPMTLTTPTLQQLEIVPAQQPASFDAKMTYEQAQSMLQALQQNGFIDTSTTADTFYYRMTGNGRHVTDKIVWIKQVSSNGAINKLAVIDFVVCCGVDITIVNVRTLIPDIFENNNMPLTMNSKTISTAIARYKRRDISEFHNDLLRCIGNIM